MAILPILCFSKNPEYNGPSMSSESTDIPYWHRVIRKTSFSQETKPSWHQHNSNSSYWSIEFFTVTQSWRCWQLCIPICLQFSSLFAPTDGNKWEIKNQGVDEDYISRLMLYWTSWFLMVELKWSWQCCHSCIGEHLWKTILSITLLLPTM